MLRKIIDLYKHSVMYAEKPKYPADQYIFFDESEQEWVGIPKASITEAELKVLNTLYEQIEFQPQAFTSISRKWYEFLFAKGQTLSYRTESSFRFIQFYIQGIGIDQAEIESALKGFFTEDVIIIWEHNNSGVVIEEVSNITLSEQELVSMTDTLESDFYVKISFYIGKVYPFTEQIRDHFKHERDFFSFAKKNLDSRNILTFEKIFPTFVAAHLDDPITQQLHRHITDVFTDDPELFDTLKIFLENNLNASMTAKGLYIHRNTLQYRIDKFVEKTGIQLKDFYGAFTVFLACMLYEQETRNNKVPKK
jgi:hypothetical protein